MMMNSYMCMCNSNYPYQYNMGSLHWCFHCSYSMPLCPSSMLDAQFNTLSESMKALQESMKEIQANNKRMLSSINHVRSLLQEEMQLYSTFTATPEILDAPITSVLESANDDCNTKVADFVKSSLDSQLPVLGVGFAIPKHISPSVLPSGSIDTFKLEFSPLSFSVKGSTLPVNGYIHKLDMEFDCKVFEILPKRDDFSEFLGFHTTIVSLLHALGLYICNWFDTGQFWGDCFEKVNSVYSVNRVLVFGSSNGFPLLSAADASDVCEVSSLTSAHKVFVDMSGRYKYAHSFNLDSTRLYTEFGSDILIMDRIILVHKIICLQLPFDLGVYVAHDVIFLCDMSKDIRSVAHTEYLCISANYVIGAVSPSALEKYIDAYDFLQYFYFCNFNLFWHPYTAVASSHRDNSFTVLGLLEQLNTIGEVPVYLWYKSNFDVNLSTGVLRNWHGLIVFSADQALHIFLTNQCARAVFGCLGNLEWSCNNDITRRAGVNMNFGASFVCDVLKDDPQSEKWYSSVFGPAPPTGFNHLQLSNGHSIVEWVDLLSCSLLDHLCDLYSTLLWVNVIRISSYTILKRSSHVVSDDKVSLKPGWFVQSNPEFHIRKFDHCWIQDGMMLEMLVTNIVLFEKIAPEVERAKDFRGKQNKRATIPYLQKQMLYEQQVDQLENFHLPLRDRLLLLRGANTTTNTIIAALGTTAAMREVTQKADTIEDIDKIIAAISEQMEIIKMVQEAIFSHVCVAVDFFESESQATNNNKEGTHTASKIILVGYYPIISPDVFYEKPGKASGPPKGLTMWSCSQHTIKYLLDVSKIGKRYVVLITSLEELSHNKCKLLDVGFVLGAGRILFMLVEKVVVPWSAFWTTEILLVPIISIHNVLNELDPTILSAGLRSKLHKKHPESLSEGFIETEVSTMAVKDKLLVAGGSEGELIVKYLNKTGVSFCSRLTYDDDAIMTAIEIYNTDSGALNFIASNDDSGVRDFDMEKFQLYNHFHFPWSVNHISLSPDGKLLIVVGDDPEGRLVDSRNRMDISCLSGHVDYSFASAWHPDGQTFATGNQDKTCRIWDVRNLSKSVTVLRGNLGAIHSIRYTSDGRFMAMAECADYVHIFDVKSAYEVEQEIDFFGEISGMSFSPDTESLFIGVRSRRFHSLLEFGRRHKYSYLDTII